MTENEIVNTLKSVALSKAKTYNKGEQYYAYAYGYLAGEMHILLKELNLSKKQQKIAEEFVNRAINRN